MLVGVVRALDRANNLARCQITSHGLRDAPCRYYGEPPPPLSMVRLMPAGQDTFEVLGPLGDVRTVLDEDFLHTDLIANSRGYGDTRWIQSGTLGSIGQGIPDYPSGLVLPGASGDYASAPDSAALSITGDLDLRVCMSRPDWTPAANAAILTKYLTTTNNRSYYLGIGPTGQIHFNFSANGTTAIAQQSTTVVGFADGSTHWLRATLDVNNGAGSYVVTWYTSNDPKETNPDAVTWTQLGATVTGPATTVFDSTANVEIGSFDGGTGSMLTGTVYYAEIRNGIAGTVVANPDFRAGGDFPAGTDLGVDDHGNIWTLAGDAAATGLHPFPTSVGVVEIQTNASGDFIQLQKLAGLTFGTDAVWASARLAFSTLSGSVFQFSVGSAVAGAVVFLYNVGVSPRLVFVSTNAAGGEVTLITGVEAAANRFYDIDIMILGGQWTALWVDGVGPYVSESAPSAVPDSASFVALDAGGTGATVTLWVDWVKVRTVNAVGNEGPLVNPNTLLPSLQAEEQLPEPADA